MDNTIAFLWFIGLYNILGSIVILSFSKENIADKILREWSELIVQPYDHGKHGGVWIIFSCLGILYLGIINILAVNWDQEVIRGIIISDVIIYALYSTLVIYAFKFENSGRGLWIALILALAQLFWGIFQLI
jgi:hypothetical protein